VLERAFANLEPRAPGAVDVIVAGLTGFDGAPETASAVAAAGIGVMALASALRAHDGRGGSQALLQRTNDEFGKPESLMDRVYRSPNPVGEVDTSGEVRLEEVASGRTRIEVTMNYADPLAVKWVRSSPTRYPTWSA
jgi:hypothetical protein